MTRLPLRVVLALIFALAMALVLAGAGWFVYARVSSDLSTSLDQELRAHAQDLSALVRHGGSLASTRGGLVENGESFAELVDRNGRVIDATPPITTSLLAAPQLQRARTGPIYVNRPSVPGLDEVARMLALPVGPNVLVAGATRQNRAEVLRSVRNAFLIGGPIALVLAMLCGYALAGAALRPIERMRRRAAAISTSSLGERLPVSPSNDEVARLGATLNEMLARIEQGVERERRFVADASHELRTPLALLKTELELALARARTTKELEETIRSAAATTERLTRLADDLLVLARSDDGRLELKLEETDLSDLVESVAKRFRVDATATPTVIRADRLRLEQALTNMIDNAVRHGRGNVLVTAALSNGTAEVHVRDDGRGFPRQFLPHAFERFSRADVSDPDGSGLGLAIVETIARAHGGSAHVSNGESGGADVWISLPAR